MAAHFKIVRSHSSLVDLESRVNDSMGLDYIPVGGPFYSGESREWCQAMAYAQPVKVKPTEEIQLREPLPAKRRA